MFFKTGIRLLSCFDVLDFFFSDSSDSVYLKGYCDYYVDPCHDENGCNCVPIRYRPAVVKLKSVRGEYLADDSF